MTNFYPQFPAINGDTLVFVSEDDLWTVPYQGGTAHRLTTSSRVNSRPAISPDGSSVAFVGTEEGDSEIYLVSIEGGPAQRLTYQGGDIVWVGWDPTGTKIRYSSSAGSPFERANYFWEVAVGEQPRHLNLGIGLSLTENAAGVTVINRGQPAREPAHHKRYRGGTAGHLWIDIKGDGQFRRMNELSGNIERPQLIGERLYFTSDYQGYGNVYSCRFDGSDLRRHSDHRDFYARKLASDGRRLTYHAGGKLYTLDPSDDQPQLVDVQVPVTDTRKARRFVDPVSYFHDSALSHDGERLAVLTRGKLFTMWPWSGPVTQLGEIDGTAYRLPTWLPGGQSLVAVGSDAVNTEYVVELSSDGVAAAHKIVVSDLGRTESITASPVERTLALTNHRGDLIVLDLTGEQPRQVTVLESATGPATDVTFSPDGRYLAFTVSQASFDNDELTGLSTIHLYDLREDKSFQVTENVLSEHSPVFDVAGKYLFFIGVREFHPTYDSMGFSMSFRSGTRPYAVVLSQDTESPFLGDHISASEDSDKSTKDEPASVHLDLEGLSHRVVPVPIEPGVYTDLHVIDGKLLALEEAPKPANSADLFSPTPPTNRTLRSVDIKTGKVEDLVENVTDTEVSVDRSTLYYRSGNKFRIIDPAKKLPEGREPGSDTGWIDIDRIIVSVQPAAEWPQMFAEAWRLQKDHFWMGDMGGIDWEAIYHQYAPLATQVGSRSEFSDLMWEMQGEVNTSHAYERGGDFNTTNYYGLGHLAAEFTFDDSTGTYRVASIAQGDPWSPEATSPLRRPGVNVSVGDEILAVNGMPVGGRATIAQRLVNLGGQEIQLLVRAPGEEVRAVAVKALRDEAAVHYRDWINRNRRAVHEATDGKVGYLHVPDMMADGYAEFHRGFLAELSRHALIIDVRFNRGGHLSQLVLDKLQTTRFGHMVMRSNLPTADPGFSRRGPLVAVTNEYAGSDGDIVSHTFKGRGLGPLIGKRTWGGVVGVNVRFFLADNTLVTQPEAATHTFDAGWSIENHGVDPDIEVEYSPQDYAAGKDPQLEMAIATALKELDQQPAAVLQEFERPDLRVGDLPPRPQDES